MVGLGIAWRLAGRATVTMFDRGKAGAGSSHAAAGMLAACCEAEPGEEALVALGRDSQARWPAFADELLRASGIDVELRREGTLLLALTADDQAEIAHRLEFQRRLDLPLEWLSAAETRKREPHLAGKIARALFSSPQDHQVDNRKLVQALRIAAETAGVNIHEMVAAVIRSLDADVLAVQEILAPDGPTAARRLRQLADDAGLTARFPARGATAKPHSRSAGTATTWD